MPPPIPAGGRSAKSFNKPSSSSSTRSPPTTGGGSPPAIGRHSNPNKKKVDMTPNSTHSVFSYLTQAGSAARMDSTNNDHQTVQVDIHSTSDGANGKMRTLEDYIRKFPVGNPNTASTIQVKATTVPLSASSVLKGTSKQAALEEEIRKFEKEAQTKKEGKEVAKTTFSHFRKQKIDAWLSIAERTNRKVRKENEALEQMAHLAQEGCIDNDAKYSEAIDALRSDLELATIVRQDNSDAIKNINQSVALIQDCIEDVCETANQQVQQERSNLKAAFERQVTRQDVRLAEVTERGKSTTEEWRAKNQQVQEELLVTLSRMEDLHNERKTLQRTHQTLKVNYEAQATDSETLEGTLKKAARQHQAIKGRIRGLEVQLAASSGAGSTIVRPQSQEATILRGTTASPSFLPHIAETSTRPPFAPANKANTTSSTDQRRQLEFDRALQHAQELLETEAANLRSTRVAHTKALRERSELEVFLRQAILLQRQAKAQRIQEGSAARPFLTQPQPTHLDDLTPIPELVFDPVDRKAVVERVLAQERVMQLLFQTEEELMESDQAEQERRWEEKYSQGGGAAAGAKQSAGQEVEGLWGRWKEWVLQANAALTNSDPRN